MGVPQWRSGRDDLRCCWLRPNQGAALSQASDLTSLLRAYLRVQEACPRPTTDGGLNNDADHNVVYYSRRILIKWFMIGEHSTGRFDQPQPPLSLEQVEGMTAEELARFPEVESLSDEILDQCSDQAYDAIELACGIREHERDNEAFEVPTGETDVSFFPSEGEVFANNPNQVTFFVLRRSPKDGQGFGGGSKVMVVIAPYVPCAHGSCGVTTFQQLKASHPEYHLSSSGIGSLVRIEGGKMEIRWGSPPRSQRPNKKDMDYQGAYPQKFADWIKEQMQEKMRGIV